MAFVRVITTLLEGPTLPGDQWIKIPQQFGDESDTVNFLSVTDNAILGMKKQDMNEMKSFPFKKGSWLSITPKLDNPTKMWLVKYFEDDVTDPLKVWPENVSQYTLDEFIKHT